MIQIKDRYTNAVLFEGEFESPKECLAAAVKARANLHGANLHGANLIDANLRGAIGNSKNIITIQTDRWTINYTSTVIQIGCQSHDIAEWWGFDDDTISDMSDDATEFWHKWKPILQQIIAANPDKPTKQESASE